MTSKQSRLCWRRIFFRWIIFNVTSLPHDSFVTCSRQLSWTCRERVVNLSGTRWITRINFKLWGQLSRNNVRDHLKIQLMPKKMNMFRPGFVQGSYTFEYAKFQCFSMTFTVLNSVKPYFHTFLCFIKIIVYLYKGPNWTYRCLEINFFERINWSHYNLHVGHSLTFRKTLRFQADSRAWKN
jgi:hypothetical protein